MKQIKIALADDHLFVRQGTISLLKEFNEICVLFDVSNGLEMMEHLKDEQPDVVLLDIDMPLMDGKETFERIKARYPAIKTVIMTTHFTDSYIIEFVKKGVSGFLSKNTSVDKLVETIKAVVEQGSYFDKAVSLIMNKAVAYPDSLLSSGQRPDLHLTCQEINIIKLLCHNKSSSEIAKLLFISIRTVEGHRLNIRRKTNCRNLMDLAAFSIKHNLISI